MIDKIPQMPGSNHLLCDLKLGDVVLTQSIRTSLSTWSILLKSLERLYCKNRVHILEPSLKKKKKKSCTNRENQIQEDKSMCQ